jgi:AcrR family transcriptional regulator
MSHLSEAMTGPFDAITPVPGPAARAKAAAVLQGRRERQQRDADARHRLLLDAAWALMSEVGLHALNMRDLGARAGYTAGALYTYFPSRDHLIAELRQRLLHLLKARVERAVAPGKKAKFTGSAEPDVAPDAFERGTLAWWQALASDPNALTLLLTGQAAVLPEGDGEDLLISLADATRACTQALEDMGLGRDAAEGLHSEVLCFGVGMLVTRAASVGSSAGRKALALRFIEMVRLWLSATGGTDTGFAEPVDDGATVQVELFGQ